MSYDRRHLYLQWGGSLPGGEEWSCGLRLANGTVGIPSLAFPTHEEIAEALNNGLGNAVAAFHTSGNTHISSSAKLEFAKLNAIDPDGRYVDSTTITRLWAPPVGGGSGTVGLHPNQVALVVTLNTLLGRGYAHRGRFYLPLPMLGPDASTGLVSESLAAEVAASAITFINALSDDAVGGVLAGMNVCVMSTHGTGATNEVQGVSVGRVLDTQRRRRRSLHETYVSATRS